MEARDFSRVRLHGYRLLFKGSKTGAYLTIEQQEGARVPVAVWEVSDQDERALDRYEGYPTFYYKTTLKDFEVKGIGRCKDRVVDAFVYIMHEERPIGIPSQQYVNVCLEGYDRFGFDREYIGEALDASYEAEEKRREENYGTAWWNGWTNKTSQMSVMW